jgi:hypothetical protein
VEIFYATKVAQLLVNVFKEVVEMLLGVALDLLHSAHIVGRCGPLGGHGRHVHVRDEKRLADGRPVMLAGALVAMTASTNFEEEGAVDPWLGESDHGPQYELMEERGRGERGVSKN